MEDNGDLTLEEAQFLFALLWTNGCTSEDLVQIADIDEKDIQLACPSWDDRAADPDGNQGSCTKLHRHKICIALQLAARGEYLINISPAKKQPETMKEKGKELEILIQQKKQLTEEIQQQEKTRRQLDEAIDRLNK